MTARHDIALTRGWMRDGEQFAAATIRQVPDDAGARLEDLPAEVIDALLDDVTATLPARDGCPAVRLEPADRARHWQLGPATTRWRGPQPPGYSAG